MLKAESIPVNGPNFLKEVLNDQAFIKSGMLLLADTSKYGFRVTNQRHF